MFYSVRGKLTAVDGVSAVIECAGVGYKCSITRGTLNELPNVGEDAFLYTYLSVREDSVELFGFSQLGELNCFKLLTSVSGVGAKVGVAILSTLSAEQVAISIAAGDSKTLTMAPGVGNKLAQRIILELKDKVAKAGGAISAGVGVDCGANSQSALGGMSRGNAMAAVDALVVLGYSHAEAATAVSALDEIMPVEELIRYALKSMAGRA